MQQVSEASAAAAPELTLVLRLREQRLAGQADGAIDAEAALVGALVGAATTAGSAITTSSIKVLAQALGSSCSVD